MNVYEKLNAVRLDFVAAPMKKSGYNPHAKFYYFELPDFIPAALRACAKHGICGIFRISEGQACLHLVNCSEPQDQIIFTAPFAGASLKNNQEVQNLGASITYLRRYLWMMALEIVVNDELDAQHSAPEKQVQQAPAPLDMGKLAAAFMNARDIQQLDNYRTRALERATPEQAEDINRHYVSRVQELIALSEATEEIEHV